MCQNINCLLCGSPEVKVEYRSWNPDDKGLLWVRETTFTCGYCGVKIMLPLNLEEAMARIAKRVKT